MLITALITDTHSSLLCTLCTVEYLMYSSTTQ